MFLDIPDITPIASSVLATIWTAVAVHLWQSTLVILPLLLLGRLLRLAPGRLLNVLWYAALIKLVLPLALLTRIGERAWHLAASRLGLVGLGGADTAGVGDWLSRVRIVLDPVLGAVIFTPNRPILPAILCVALTVIWFTGVLWMVRRMGRTHRSRMTGRSRALAMSGAALRERVGAALAGTPISPGRLDITPDSTMPAVVGLLRPRIQLPQRLVEALSVAELRAILLHEAEHCRRRDPLRGVLGNVLALLFFYYPLLWPLLRRLRGSMEIACDEAVLRAGIDPAICARALARTLRLNLHTNHSPAAVDPLRSSLLRQRFERLEQTERYLAMPRHRLAIAIAILLVAGVSFFPLAPQGNDPGLAVAATTASTDRAAEPVSAAGADDSTADLDRMPRLIQSSVVRPEYPDAARRAGRAGKVLLDVVVTVDGVAGEITVLEGVEEFPAFAENAVEAVKQWRFEPGVRDAEPVEAHVVIPIQYRLDCDQEGAERESRESKSSSREL